MAYESTVSTRTPNPGIAVYSITETGGPDPADTSECVTLDTGVPYAVVTILSVFSWISAGAASTVQPILRRSIPAAIPDPDPSIAYDPGTSAASPVVYTEPRAVVQADAAGRLYLYSTPDASPGAAGSIRPEIMVRYGAP